MINVDTLKQWILDEEAGLGKGVNKFSLSEYVGGLRGYLRYGLYILQKHSILGYKELDIDKSAAAKENVAHKD